MTGLHTYGDREICGHDPHDHDVYHNRTHVRDHRHCPEWREKTQGLRVAMNWKKRIMSSLPLPSYRGPGPSVHDLLCTNEREFDLHDGQGVSTAAVIFHIKSRRTV